MGAGLALGLLALFLITAIGPLFDGDLTVSSYDAVLNEDGTLSEHYTYDVGSSGQYRMLYRDLGGAGHPQHQHGTVYPAGFHDTRTGDNRVCEG